MIIETKRLILREYNNDDFKDLCEVLLDRVNMKHYVEAFDETAVKRWINWNLDNYKTFGFGLWAIVLKENGKMIGDCGITMQRINGRIRPEIGYHINRNYHNQGYATEAARACKDYVFENTPFNEIYSYMNYDNLGSCKVAIKNDMQLVEEYDDPIDKQIKVYAITRVQWEALKTLNKQGKKYKTAVFDLDGTLLDTLGDLTNSINYVLEKLHYPLRTKAEVRSFMGNGIKKLVELAIPNGMNNPDFDKAYKMFLEHYQIHCNDVTMPYPGIMKLLDELTKREIKIAIVSNKVDESVKALNDSYFKEYIKVAIGENEKAGIRKKPYPDTVWQALEQLNAVQEESVYIGDTEVDAATASNSHLDCVLVKWGFRDMEVLSKQNVRDIIDDPADLLKYFD